MLAALLHQVIAADPVPLSPRVNRVSAGRRTAEQAEVSALRVVILFLVILALTGCPGPNYAPYNNMRNSYG